MKSRIIQRTGARTHILVFDTGDEVSSGLLGFARQHRIRAASVAGIGAFSDAVVGFFDLERKDYDRIEIREQVEVLSLAGNLGRYDGEPLVHVHVVLGRRDGSAVGGHLLEAHVRPTLELVLTELDGTIERRRDASTGLPLIEP